MTGPKSIHCPNMDSRNVPYASLNFIGVYRPALCYRFSYLTPRMGRNGLRGERSIVIESNIVIVYDFVRHDTTRHDTTHIVLSKTGSKSYLLSILLLKI